MNNPSTLVNGRTITGGFIPLAATADGALRVASGFPIPQHDKTTNAYHGSTNNLASITYSRGATNVARIDIAYVGGVPTANNALELSRTLVLL